MILFTSLFNEYELAQIVYKDIKSLILLRKYSITSYDNIYKITLNFNSVNYNNYLPNGKTIHIKHIKKLSKKDNNINIIMHKTTIILDLDSCWPWRPNTFITTCFYIKPNFRCSNCHTLIYENDTYYKLIQHKCVLPYRIVKKYCDIIFSYE